MTNPRWRSSFLGGDRVLTLREAPAAGEIRVHGCLPGRPRLATLLARLGPGAVADPEPLVTAEGEHGAVVTVSDARTVAFVFGDAHYARIDGEARDPALYPVFARAVRVLAHGHRLGLGAERCRRFLYDPPPGWTGIRHPRETLWLAPGYPRPRWSIRVHDAWPLEAGPSPFGHPEGPTTRLTLARGLEAEITACEQETGLASEASLCDEGYAYRLRLESDEGGVAEAGRIFAALLRSIRALRPSPVAAELFSAWQD